MDWKPSENHLSVESYCSFMETWINYSTAIFRRGKPSEYNFDQKLKKEAKDFFNNTGIIYHEITDLKTPFKNKVWVRENFFNKFSGKEINMIVGCGHELPSYFPKKNGKHSCHLRQDSCLHIYHDDALTICKNIIRTPDILCNMSNNSIPTLITLFGKKGIKVQEIVGCGLNMDSFRSSLFPLTKRIYSYGGIWPPTGYKSIT